VLVVLFSPKHILTCAYFTYIQFRVFQVLETHKLNTKLSQEKFTLKIIEINKDCFLSVKYNRNY
jgi:hypothetical protein